MEKEVYLANPFLKINNYLAKVSQLSIQISDNWWVNFSADDAYEKNCKTSALQIYSALTFIGPKVINDICEGLEKY